MAQFTHNLYKEIILDHSRNPRNRGRLENPDIRVKATNPLCGDELELMVALDGENISDVKVQIRGCSISQASASMMTEAIKGQKLEKAEQFGRLFKAMMLDEQNGPLPVEIQDLQVLEVAKRYQSRIKCTLLAWQALLESVATSDRRRLNK